MCNSKIVTNNRREYNNSEYANTKSIKKMQTNYGYIPKKTVKAETQKDDICQVQDSGHIEKLREGKEMCLGS